MQEAFQSLTSVLTQADDRLRSGVSASAAVWATGFDGLDNALSGGMRSGELVLLAGPQGVGKTTLTLQVVRNVAMAGHPVIYFSFEHDGQAILERLLALEMPTVTEVGRPGVTLHQVRGLFDASDGFVGCPLVDRLSRILGGLDALDRLRSYSDCLHVHRSSGSHTSMSTVRDLAKQIRGDTGQPPLVVVDYLQKVRVPGPVLPDEERVAMVAEGLKDLAMDQDLPVLAVVAADKEGIEAGRRLRMQNLRGSSALAYESDIVLIMNEKYDIVARHHLVYDLGNAQRFREWVVLSIDKNRSGRDKIDLELRKQLNHGRFEGTGNQVSEQLVDDRIFVD